MRRLLVVEDEVDLQELIFECFQNDYVVVCVGTLSDAEKQLRAIYFDAILLDVTLPDGDGFRFGAKLLTDPDHRHAIIFMTGHPEIQERVDELASNRVSCVIKPYSISDLMAQVSKLCPSGEELMPAAG